MSHRGGPGPQLDQSSFEEAPASEQLQLGVLMSDLQARESFLESQLRSETSNFLAVLGSVGSAVTIYLSQAQGLGQSVSGTLLLGVALVFIWFPMNQAWHLTEARAAEKYIFLVLAPEIRKFTGASSNSRMLTWTSYRFSQIEPNRFRWYIAVAMVARGAVVFIPTLSLVGYSVTGLNGDAPFDENNVLQWLLLVMTCAGIMISGAALWFPYLKGRYKRELLGDEMSPIPAD